tara:strand:+ start:4343 stop:6022 length:1680 start_codon:yes stop_codon:yes gene_type:complete
LTYRDEELLTLKRGRDSQTSTEHFDTIVVGAGFAGLYALHRMRGLGLDTKVIEAAPDVGGTWYWNRYPGARCDVESVEYCYSFSTEIDQEWSWTERYASQPEILKYLQFVADRLDLRCDILFETRVRSGHFNESENLWELTTSIGQKFTARYCIMASGNLTVPSLPNIPGIEDFAGEIIHTADWPSEPQDFSRKRVGVIGTGSSGCQVIPILAERAKELVVFQRTPNHCLPAHNGPIEPEYYSRLKQRYSELRRRWRSSPLGTSWPVGTRSAMDVSERERQAVYQHRWDVGGASIVASFDDLFISREANDSMADFVRGKVREIVDDSDVAEQLVPADHPMGAKRVTLVTNYYEAFNRDNVRLVAASRAPIKHAAEDGIVAGDELIPLDVLVCATGFDAITGALLRIDIRGRDDVRLKDLWQDGPETMLGLMVAGLPNMFIVTGPGSPSVLSNVVVSIEQHIDWIADCIEHLERKGFATIEAEPAAQQRWMAHVDEVAAMTLFPQAKSWYSGDNIEGKPSRFTVYVGGLQGYREALEGAAEAEYRDFVLTKSSVRDGAIA